MEICSREILQSGCCRQYNKLLEMCTLVLTRFHTDCDVNNVMLTHSNINQPNMKHCILDCDEDIQSFFFINKLAAILWGLPLCVVLRQRKSENIKDDADRQRNGGYNFCEGENNVKNTSAAGRVGSSSPHTLDDMFEAGVTDNLTLPDVGVVKRSRLVEHESSVMKGRCFRSKEELNLAMSLHAQDI